MKASSASRASLVGCWSGSSEITLALLQFHRAFFIVIDGAIFALGTAEGNHLLDNLGERVGLGANRAGARHAAQRPHAADHALRFFARQQLGFIGDDDNGAIANDDVMFAGEIQRHDGNIFQVDVQPDIQLGPIGKRKYADALAFVDARIKNIPQFGTLALGVPLAKGIAEGVNSFLGARFFLVAAGAAKRRRNRLRPARPEAILFSAGRSTSACPRQKGSAPWSSAS